MKLDPTDHVVNIKLTVEIDSMTYEAERGAAVEDLFWTHARDQYIKSEIGLLTDRLIKGLATLAAQNRESVKRLNEVHQRVEQLTKRREDIQASDN